MEPSSRLPDDSGQFKRLVSLKNEVYAITERGLFKPDMHDVSASRRRARRYSTFRTTPRRSRLPTTA